jgi:hypothetical protein
MKRPGRVDRGFVDIDAIALKAAVNAVRVERHGIQRSLLVDPLR